MTPKGGNVVDIYKKPMTVAIVGSRSFSKKSGVDMAMYKIVKKFVAKLPKQTEVVSGGAKGIDTYAYDCAHVRGMPRKEILPKKELPSPAKFHERNTRLVKYLTDQGNSALVAFMDEEACDGTKSTVKKARAKGIPCMEIYFSPQGDFLRVVADDTLKEDE